MPGMSGSGNMMPMSRTTIRPSSSRHAQFRPISPRPPRKMIRTGSGKRPAYPCTGHGGHVAPEIGEHGTGPVLELGGGRAEGEPALAGGEAEDATGRLGRERIREELARLEVVGLEELGVGQARPLVVT